MSRFRTARVAVGAALFIAATVFVALPADAQNSQQTREIKAWPFKWDSIWNMPIGSDAQYVSAGFAAPGQAGMTIDEDIIILEPSAPLMDVRLNTAGWDPTQNRCTSGANGKVIASLPIPANFSTGAYVGSTPNQSSAVLNADGNTLHQSQPFHVCNGYATSQYIFSAATLDGDGQVGAHGGSALSSLGGTLRVGELRPGSGAIRHALKLNLDMQRYGGCRQDGTPCFRWPALQADSIASQPCVPGNVYGGGYCRGTGTLEMGSLLALPPGFDIGSLTSAPARQLATALRDYGAYAADATGWDVFGLMTEWGPAGRFTDQFEKDWGHSMTTMTLSTCGVSSPDCAWSTEMAKIIQALSVVENNGPSSIGGPGSRIAACAPAFTDGTGGGPSNCSAANSTGAAATTMPAVTTVPSAPTVATTPTAATKEAVATTLPTATTPDATVALITVAPTVATVATVSPVVSIITTPTSTPSSQSASVIPVFGEPTSSSSSVPATSAAPAAQASAIVEVDFVRPPSTSANPVSPSGPSTTTTTTTATATATATVASTTSIAAGPSVQVVSVLGSSLTQPEELAFTGSLTSTLARYGLLVFVGGFALRVGTRRRPAHRRRS